MSDSLLDTLARLAGLSTAFTDAFGRRVVVGEASVRAVLAGLRLDTGDEEGLRAGVARLEQFRGGPVPPVLALSAGEPGSRQMRGGDGGRWTLVLESGETLTGSAPSGVLSWPALPPGYHRLVVETAGGEHQATIVCAPPACWQPDPIERGERLWGATAQVYGLRSAGNFGIGDYGDVADLARGVGRLGGSFLGLSPVHALFSADRTKFSPYSPSSRQFLETGFIDATAVPGFAGSEAARRLAGGEAEAALGGVRSGALVDYEGAWALKSAVLESLWAEREWTSDPSFAAFRRAAGDALERHATFEALSEHHRAHGRWWAGEWPEQHRGPDTADVLAFREAHGGRVAFHAWLQWLADAQLATAAAACREAGMPIGLYRDLAVGADAGGSEVWSHPHRFATSLSIGAPPDPLGPQGQNWGLPPFDPLVLEGEGLAGFREMVVANMRHAGAIRIDHAFQLRRVFVVPQGMSAAEGAYLDMPFDALVAVLRLESHRQRCMVIGEDLGTAPEGFSDAIMRAGMSSYRVAWFEREGADFKPPSAYPERALAVFTTHDLPTFAGWWRGVDIDLRRSLGVYDHDQAEREHGTRARDRADFTAAMAREGVIAASEPPETPPLEAMTRFLARTRSSLVGLQIEDALGEPNQANLPGPDLGHPNWRRKLAADIDTLVAPGGDLAKLAAVMGSEGRGIRAAPAGLAAPPPRATYRIQFHAGFTFDDAVAIVPYLASLGISHLYASPIQTARPGSTHGYDIVDHASVNPELGGEEGFVRLTDALRAHGLGLILDIVPNHMGVGGADNAWWLSVLEWGEVSPHAPAFDTDWDRLGANRKLVVPVLGRNYGEALEEGELKLVFDGERGSFAVHHWEHTLPVVPTAYPIILDRALAVLDPAPDPDRTSLLAVSERLRAMGDETSGERRAAFPAEAEELKARLARAAASPAIREAIERAVALVNGEVGTPESFGTLHRILELQSYRAAHWRVAASEINYRRFFDINSLAGLRVEDPAVFAATHALILRLVRGGRIQGLRIDHIDGLADPEGYVKALQAEIGPGFYIVVEKILEPAEPLRPWPVAGTTGYDVLNLIDGLFVDQGHAGAINRIYRARAEVEGRYGALLRQTKAEILESSFASELEVLVSDGKRIADGDRRTRDITLIALRRALIEIVARFPVYRTYIADGALADEDRRLIDTTVEKAKRDSVLPDLSTHDFVARALLGDIETDGPGRPTRDWVQRFRRRFQQLTGPVMAKSLEDTLFYRFVPLLALNEVGGDPNRFGVCPEEFHAANADRAAAWPDAMIATATHDTKRGEDARARLLALSQMPDAYAEGLDRFDDLIAADLATVDGEAAPDMNDRILLFQAILGAWPENLLREEWPQEAADDFRERVRAFLVKALREAKRHTSWVHVRQPYEEAAGGLVDRLLVPGSPFVTEFLPLARRLAAAGLVSGLARTVLKVTLPGVPDFYQGTELWDFSLVDPDNRRAVDYASRAAALAAGGRVEDLAEAVDDGRLKQFVIARLLADRAADPVLYADGDYGALVASGEKARYVVGFTRRRGGDALVVAVPRLTDGLAPENRLPLGEVWADTELPLPSGTWTDLLTGRTIVADGRIACADLFACLPVAVLRGQT